jgi:hypothetical protein
MVIKGKVELADMISQLSQPNAQLLSDIKSFLSSTVNSKRTTQACKGPSAWSILATIHSFQFDTFNESELNWIFQIVESALECVQKGERQLTFKQYDIDKLIANLTAKFIDVSQVFYLSFTMIFIRVGEVGI